MEIKTYFGDTDNWATEAWIEKDDCTIIITEGDDVEIEFESTFDGATRRIRFTIDEFKKIVDVFNETVY